MQTAHVFDVFPMDTQKRKIKSCNFVISVIYKDSYQNTKTMNSAFIVRDLSTQEETLCYFEDILDWLVESLPENPTLYQIVSFDENNQEIVYTVQEFAQLFRFHYVQKRLCFLKSQVSEIVMLEQELAQLLAKPYVTIQ